MIKFLLYVIVFLLCWPIALLIAAGYLVFFAIQVLIWLVGAMLYAYAAIAAVVVVLAAKYRDHRIEARHTRGA